MIRKNSDNLVRKSIQLDSKIEKALKIMAAFEKTHEYIILNQALEKFIPKKYFDMADMIQEKK